MNNDKIDDKITALATYLKNRDIELNGEGHGSIIHCDTYYLFMAKSIIDFLERFDRTKETYAT